MRSSEELEKELLELRGAIELMHDVISGLRESVEILKAREEMRVRAEKEKAIKHARLLESGVI